MNHRSIVAALLTLRPGAAWTLRTEDLSGLEWIDTLQSRPTDSEILAQIDAQASQ